MHPRQRWIRPALNPGNGSSSGKERVLNHV
jgi:hypothetical protein